MVFRAPIWLALLPLLLVATGALLWRNQWSRMVVALRALLVTLLVLALADPARPGTPATGPLLVLADQSASLGDAAQSTWERAQDIAQQRDDAPTILAAIGPTVALSTGDKPPPQPPGATNLAGALQFAAGLQPQGGRVLLVSNGAAAPDGVDQAITRLQQRGVLVDVLPVATAQPHDARITKIVVPAGIRVEQSFEGQVHITTTFPTSATLVVSLNDTVLAHQQLTLAAGQTVIPLPARAPGAGSHRLRAELQLNDHYASNNLSETTLLANSPPRVLVVERQPGSATSLRSLLKDQGVQTEAIRPDGLSSTLADLERFDAIMLQDIPATALSPNQQTVIHDYVQTLGHGLLVLGGANSYSLGSYAGTPLETVLPVTMQAPPTRQRQPVAMLLMIDRSASMSAPNRAASRLDLAKGGALAATEALAAGDRVGVLTFDTQMQWSVPFQRLGDGLTLDQIQDQIRTIDYGGGTNVYRALQTGLDELARQDAPVRHALLLTDGRSYGTDAMYRSLAEQARANNITLSTLAIGTEADTRLLSEVANWGGGRYHFAAEPTQLPQITLQETLLARDNPRIEGTFQPQPEDLHPITRSLVPNQLPQLNGYVGLTPKPSADEVLVSPNGDPILAAWQYGLGRAVAWTSDSGEDWGAAWHNGQPAAILWSQALDYVVPDPAQGPLTARVEDRDGMPVLVAGARTIDGTPLDLAGVGAQVQAPNGTPTAVRLHQTTPGQYEAPLTPTEGGAYTIQVTLQKGAQQFDTQLGWTYTNPNDATPLPNPALLEQIATATGGRILTSTSDVVDAQGAATQAPYAWWPWLVGAAALLWPLDIALRRRLGLWR